MQWNSKLIMFAMRARERQSLPRRYRNVTDLYRHGQEMTIPYDDIEALRWTHGKLLLKSGKHFQAGLIEPEDEAKFAVGTCVHGKYVEGKDLRSLFAIKPKAIDYRTNIGKAWRNAQTLPILREEESEVIEKMADALLLDPRARQFIEGCKLREHVIVQMLQGVKCKSRLDMVGIDRENRPGFVELKTSLDVRKDFWRKRCVNEPFHYDGQVEFYAQMLALDMELESRPWSVWLCVENKPPFDIAVYAPVDYMIASGIEKVNTVLQRFKEYTAANLWPGVSPNGIEPLDAPEWRAQQLAHNL